MKLSDLTLMARDLASLEIDDQAALKACHQNVRELEQSLRARHEPELAACLAAVTQVIDAFADAPRSPGRAKAKDVVCRMLDALGSELADVTIPQPERPDDLQDLSKSSLDIHVEDDEEEPPDEESEQRADMSFGRMLIELGHVTRDQVATALRFHRAKGPRLGECLLIQGVVSPEHLLNALKIQDLLRSTPRGLCPETLARYKEAIAEETEKATPTREVDQRVTQEIFFGEVLLGAEMITNEQLEAAMHKHHKEGMRVGEALVQMGALTEEDVEAGLMLQKQLRRIAGARVPS